MGTDSSWFFLVLISANTYVMQRRFIPAASETNITGDTYYVVPAFQHLMTGATTGLIAMGLGAALFYLRHLYLRRFYGSKS